jgi:hypothetical protein
MHEGFVFGKNPDASIKYGRRPVHKVVCFFNARSPAIITVLDRSAVSSFALMVLLISASQESDPYEYSITL